MQRVTHPTSIDEPTFLTEIRGGWDEWDTQREVLTAVALPSGDELTTNDEVTVTLSDSPVDVPGDGEVAATVEVGSWVGDGRQVEVEGFDPKWFSVHLSEDEFRNAWGEWLHP